MTSIGNPDIGFAVGESERGLFRSVPSFFWWRRVTWGSNGSDAVSSHTGQRRL
jgi:hypothetical protein